MSTADAILFGNFKKAREEAHHNATATRFKAARQACVMARTNAAVGCGANYCKANNICGKPCGHKWGQAGLQVIPMQPVGKMFYKVQSLTHKEKLNKERRSKEVQRDLPPALLVIPVP